jgi:hypothetical protein
MMMVDLVQKMEEKAKPPCAGYNAAGKTNLLKSLAVMKYTVLYSGSSSTNLFLTSITPFLLKADSSEPTHFEIIFFVNNKKYRYGFRVHNGIVLQEWLFYAEPKVRENNLFNREKRGITYNKNWNKEADNSLEALFKRVQDHTLFISVLGVLNVQPAVDILKWFEKIVKEIFFRRIYYRIHRNRPFSLPAITLTREKISVLPAFGQSRPRVLIKVDFYLL